jgi:hypothetical protein
VRILLKIGRKIFNIKFTIFNFKYLLNPENALGSHGGSEAQRNKRDMIILAENHIGASLILNLPYTIQYSGSP